MRDLENTCLDQGKGSGEEFDNMVRMFRDRLEQILGNNNSMGVMNIMKDTAVERANQAAAHQAKPHHNSQAHRKV